MQNVITEEQLKVLTAKAELGEVNAQADLGEYYYHDHRRSSAKLAVMWLQRAAAKGNVNAQYMLGHCRAWAGYGGLRQSSSAALKHFEAAAQQGHIDAMYMTGHLCSDFDKPNYEKALYWFRRGAELGNVSCMIGLARLYRDGHGVSRDVNKAIELFEKASEQSASACHCLEYIYKDGLLVPQDLDKAAFWSKKADEIRKKS